MCFYIFLNFFVNNNYIFNEGYYIKMNINNRKYLFVSYKNQFFMLLNSFIQSDSFNNPYFLHL